MSSCVLCASLQVRHRAEICFETRHNARSHANLHFLHTKHFDDGHCNSLDQVFEQCFPNFVVTPINKKRKIVVKKEGRQSLLDVCRTVFKGRISKASPRVTCQKCGSKIKLYGGVKKTGLDFGIPINHASAHMGTDLFECRKCGRSFRNRSALCKHLRATHHLRCLSEHFTDKSNDFVEEITTSIEQCFTEGNNNGPSDEKARMIRLKNEVRVRSNTKGSKLAIERQLFCHYLIRQLAGDDGKIQCRLCPKGINIKQEDGYKVQGAMEHALVHLKKPLFRCKVCSSVLCSRDSLRLHLKSVHVLPLLNNYDCLADDFHADVLDVLRKCYADESDK